MDEDERVRGSGRIWSIYATKKVCIKVLRGVLLGGNVLDSLKWRQG